MNLIKINLLPYRELREQKQKKLFQLFMLGGFVAGVIACGVIYTGLAGMIANQDGRNESLEAGIKTLDGELAKIKDLKEKRTSFLERKQKVEELDNKRFEGARIIDTINQLVPDGAYLTDLRPNDTSANGVSGSKNYTLTGKAISDNKVAMFMTALPSTGVFENPKLISIKKTDNGQEFIVTVGLVEQKIITSDNESPATSASSVNSNSGSDAK